MFIGDRKVVVSVQLGLSVKMSEIDEIGVPTRHDKIHCINQQKKGQTFYMLVLQLCIIFVMRLDGVDSHARYIAQYCQIK